MFYLFENQFSLYPVKFTACKWEEKYISWDWKHPLYKSQQHEPDMSCRVGQVPHDQAHFLETKFFGKLVFFETPQNKLQTWRELLGGPGPPWSSPSLVAVPFIIILIPIMMMPILWFIVFLWNVSPLHLKQPGRQRRPRQHRRPLTIISNHYYRHNHPLTII